MREQSQADQVSGQQEMEELAAPVGKDSNLRRPALDDQQRRGDLVAFGHQFGARLAGRGSGNRLLERVASDGVELG